MLIIVIVILDNKVKIVLGSVLIVEALFLRLSPGLVYLVSSSCLQQREKAVVPLADILHNSLSLSPTVPGVTVQR